MATPQNADQEWSPDRSVQAWNTPTYNRGSPSVTDGRWSPYPFAPTPGGRVDSQDRQRWFRSPSLLSQQHQPHRLGFVPVEDWNNDTVSNESPPRYIRYSIEWKVILKKKAVVKDTEQDVVLSPELYWQMYLQPRLEERMQKKSLAPPNVRVEETEVVVSVTGRKERPLTRQFDELQVDWSVVERKLLEWSELFRTGKKLRVDLHIRCVERGPLNTNEQSSARKTTTQRMLTERRAQLDAETIATGQPEAWRQTYEMMRCDCQHSPHQHWCWYDSRKQRRYPLNNRHLRTLVEYAEGGGPLNSYDDVPDTFRQQMYEEEARSTRKKAVGTGMDSHERLPI